MRMVVLLLILVLLCFHQDYWQWDDARLVFGFVPYSLAYHTVLSFAAAALWLVAVQYAWPKQVDVDGTAGGGEER